MCVLGPGSDAGHLPVAPGARGCVLGGGEGVGKPLGTQPIPPGAAPASSKLLWLLARSQRAVAGTGRVPVPALGTALTQPEEPYLAPAPSPVAQSPLWGHSCRDLAPRPPPAPHPDGCCQAPGPPHAF